MSHNHHTHSHNHLGTHDGLNKKVLSVSLLIIGSYMLIELIGGVWTNSLALLSDAGHMFSDALALGLSLIAFHLSERPVNHHRTYGYHRFEVIAAALNGLALIIIAILIIYEAIGRLIHPPEIATMGMLIISIIGLVINIIVALYMHHSSDAEHNINMQSAYLHVLGDLFGSIGAIIAAVLMIIFGWSWADPVSSIMVAILIGFSAWGILKTTLQVLMEGTPSVLELETLHQIMLSVEGIQSVHDLHVWTITSNMHALSCHIVVDGKLSVAEAEQLVKTLEHKLHQYQIYHVTIQIESAEHKHHNTLLCNVTAGKVNCQHQDN